MFLIPELIFLITDFFLLDNFQNFFVSVKKKSPLVLHKNNSRQGMVLASQDVLVGRGMEMQIECR